MCRKERYRGFSWSVSLLPPLFLLCFSGGLIWSQETPASSQNSAPSSTSSYKQQIETLLNLSDQRLALSRKQVPISTDLMDSSLSLAALYASSQADLSDIASGINGLATSLDKSLQELQPIKSSVDQASTSISQSTTASEHSSQLSTQISQVMDKEIAALRERISIWRVVALFFAGTTVGYAIDGPRGALIGGASGAAAGGVLWLFRI